nr:uncharacterized protein LOC124807504 [Hydra vulgaris]
MLFVFSAINPVLMSTNASLQERAAVSSQVFQHVRSAAVSAAANIINSPSASVSQVNLARIASTDRMSSENAMKLDIIIENQEEIKAMLRSLVAVSGDDVLDDVFPQKMKNEHELRQLEIMLKDPSYRKNMINNFGSLGGRNCKDAIRRIMRTTAANQLWSLFSFNGRKGKLSFESCLLCQVVMKACKKIIKDANVQKIEEEIREVLKHAPNQPGGVNYEAKIVANTPSKDVLLQQAEESSDSENTE